MYKRTNPARPNSVTSDSVNTNLEIRRRVWSMNSDRARLLPSIPDKIFRVGSKPEVVLGVVPRVSDVVVRWILAVRLAQSNTVTPEVDMRYTFSRRRLDFSTDSRCPRHVQCESVE